MQTAPSLENVYEAVYTLFNNQNSSEKEKASAWLDELQKSVRYIFAIFSSTNKLIADKMTDVRVEYHRR